MEILRFNVLPEHEVRRREKVKYALAHCTVCHGKLEFSYFDTLEDQKLEEVAHCKDCGRKAMNQIHAVH
jgi:NAD-dependent SIR2 family protein deacetylase